MRIIKFRHGSYGPPRRVPLGTPGLVGDLVRQMRGPISVTRKTTEWRPPYEYEFCARYLPEDQQAPYIQRCEQWLQEHTANSQPKLEIEECDLTVVHALYEKYCKLLKRPPIDELVEAYQKAGASQARIQKIKNMYRKWEENSDEEQKKLDRIFAKYPSALKTTKKEPVKKKIIRAVKKKINVEQ